MTINFLRLRTNNALAIAVSLGVAAGSTLHIHAGMQKTLTDYKADHAALIEAYRRVEVASVSDAIEQTLHEKRYLSHHMQAMSPGKFAGTAVTVKLIPEENHDPEALTGMLQAIDASGPAQCT